MGLSEKTAPFLCQKNRKLLMETLDEDLAKEGYAKEEEDWRLFIGNNYNEYIPKWRLFREDGGKVSFNFAALFFNILWLLTRKMYSFVVIGIALWLGALLGVSLIVELIGFYIIGVGFLVNSAVLFCLGFMGDWLYYIHSTKKIAKIRQKFSDDKEYRKELVKAGGFGGFGVILFLSLVFIMIYLINLLLDGGLIY